MTRECKSHSLSFWLLASTSVCFTVFLRRAVRAAVNVRTAPLPASTVSNGICMCTITPPQRAMSSIRHETDPELKRACRCRALTNLTSAPYSMCACVCRSRPRYCCTKNTTLPCTIFQRAKAFMTAGSHSSPLPHCNLQLRASRVTLILEAFAVGLYMVNPPPPSPSSPLGLKSLPKRPSNTQSLS